MAFGDPQHHVLGVGVFHPLGIGAGFLGAIAPVLRVL
jgi:hypothetical protein